jgi:hypothetical protein
MRKEGLIMERDLDLEATIGLAATRLEMAQREIYDAPKLSLKLFQQAEDGIQKAYMKIVKRTGGKVKE